MSGIFRQTVTRVRAGTRTNRAGDTELDWSEAAISRVEVNRLSVQPSFQREEHATEGNPRITGYRVISRPGNVPDITGLDRIEYAGNVYQVDGDVALWPDPRRGRDHVEFSMSRHRGR